MISLSELINQTKELNKEIREHNAYIQRENAVYQEKISCSVKKIKHNEELISEIRRQELFINVDDIVEVLAKEWGYNKEDLSVEIKENFYYPSDVDVNKLKKLDSFNQNQMVLKIKCKDGYSLTFKATVRKDDIQLDGKKFGEHIIVKPFGNLKELAVDDYRNIVLRFCFNRIIFIEKDGSLSYQNTKGKILAQALQRKEERERKESLKSCRLTRLCPDCGKIISYYSHFKAYMHSNSEECAYMEDKKGKRTWDNQMRKEALEKAENEKVEVYDTRRNEDGNTIVLYADETFDEKM